MTISDQSMGTGFSESLPVMHQRDISDTSAMSGLPSGEMPGHAGQTTVPFVSCAHPQHKGCSCPSDSKPLSKPFLTRNSCNVVCCCVHFARIPLHSLDVEYLAQALHLRH